MDKIFEGVESEEEQKNLKEKYTKIVKLNGVHYDIKAVEVVTPDRTGDNLMSQCEWVTIHFKDEDKSSSPLEFFVKNAIKSNDYAVIMREMGVFERESIFFNQILPHLTQFCRQKDGYTNFLDGIFPKTFYADRDSIVMENLTKKGYTMLSKTEPHGFALASKVMELFAKFHSATYALIGETGVENFIKKFPITQTANSWSKASEDISAGVVNSAVNCCIKTLEKFPTEGGDAAIKFLRTYESNGFEKYSRYFDLGNESCGIVLNHGDAWNGNLMFRQNLKKKETEVIFIDFQVTHLGSPVLDLLYYIYLSVNVEVRHQQWRQFLAIYFKKFRENLEILKGTLNFSLEDLESDYRKKCVVGFILELYIIFGWDVVNDLGDPQAIDGAVGHHFDATVNLRKDKLRDANGPFYAAKIVEAFHNFQSVV